MKNETLRGRSWKLKYKRQKHGLVNEPAYESWHKMKRRCNDPKDKDYPNYGAREITYDPAWEDFTVFFADMGRRPDRTYSLERKDNNGNYCKENCIWMLKIYQTRNQTTTKFSMEKAREIRAIYAAGGISQRALAAKYGTSQATIAAMLINKTWKEL